MGKAIIGVIVGLLVGLAIGIFLVPVFVAGLAGSHSVERDSQIITAIQREEQVVLLSLGIQGLHTRESSSEVLGIDIPWSGRTSLLEYSFRAKLGIDGEHVDIESTGENAFVISIPQFIFIGHEDESFRLASENHGILSWTTPAVDSSELITEILNSDAQQTYIAENVEMLREQAEAFYRGIVEGIDPEISLRFAFAD